LPNAVGEEGPGILVNADGHSDYDRQADDEPPIVQAFTPLHDRLLADFR
jgi:hypothetical protein